MTRRRAFLEAWWRVRRAVWTYREERLRGMDWLGYG
jgi:hypothetical protein